jgi:photosystem II stability/assembly factor-like uncharacterized protein
MKKLASLIFALFLMNATMAQWFWQNPLPQCNFLTSIKFTDANTGYTVGDGGTILKTTNGGTNWVALLNGISNGLKSVYFTNANKGYAVG